MGWLLAALPSPPVFFSKDLLRKVRPLAPKYVVAKDISLSNIRDNPGARQRVNKSGRGLTSGKGRTHGKGTGSQPRHPPRPGFEGGQMPLYRQLPKVKATFVDFENLMKPVTLGDIQAAIDLGLISPDHLITPLVLLESGVIKNVPKWPGIRIKAYGYDVFCTKISIEANWIDPDACKVIQHYGGTARSLYQDKDYYEHSLRPHKAAPDQVPSPQLPPPKLWVRYREEGIQGYLVGKDHLWHELVDRVTFRWTPELKAKQEQMLAEEFRRREAEGRTRREREWTHRVTAKLRRGAPAATPALPARASPAPLAMAG